MGNGRSLRNGQELASSFGRPAVGGAKLHQPAKDLQEIVRGVRNERPQVWGQPRGRLNAVERELGEVRNLVPPRAAEPAENLQHHLLHSGGPEKAVATAKACKQHAHRPTVRRGTPGNVAQGDLNRPEPQGLVLQPLRREVWPAGPVSRKTHDGVAEINDRDDPRIRLPTHVGGLEVRVHDVTIVNVSKTGRNLQGDFPPASRREQVGPELLGEVQAGVSEDQNDGRAEGDIQQSDDVRVPQAGQNSHLIHEVQTGVLLLELFLHHLLACRDHDALAYYSKAALANALTHLQLVHCGGFGARRNLSQNPQSFHHQPSGRVIGDRVEASSLGNGCFARRRADASRTSRSGFAHERDPESRSNSRDFASVGSRSGIARRQASESRSSRRDFGSQSGRNGFARPRASGSRSSLAVARAAG